MNYIISGHIYFADGQHLSLPIGTFDSMQEAIDYMYKLEPFLGEWEVVPLWSPK